MCNLVALPKNELDAVLLATAVGEVWGVGRRIVAQLEEGGIHTVLELLQWPAFGESVTAARLVGSTNKERGFGGFFDVFGKQ